MSENKKCTVVFTTINDPVLMNDYFSNFKRYNHLENINVIIIPDKKTPAKIFDRCNDLNKRGLSVTCPTLEEQDAYLKKIGLEESYIPYNSDNRRNIGYLMALEGGSEFIISIDDDNYCLPNEDFVKEHSVVLNDSLYENIVNSKSGWFNVCEMLEVDSAKTVYARGYPYNQRHKNENVDMVSGESSIHINAGLWLNDPDVDGISWLVNPAHATGFKGKSFVLGKNTWSPVNTQNTALRRDAVTAYYFVKMGYPLRGMPIDRYGDIFSGYFVQACAKHLGGSVRFGTPIADHKRNSHNYMNDAANEWACIMVLEDLLPWLSAELKLEGKNYTDAFISLADQMNEAVEKMKGKIWNDATKAYFHQMAHYMIKWAKTCRKIGY